MIDKKFLKNLNVLYVEDEVAAAKKFSSVLNKIFNTVYLALNGEEALKIYEKNHIDIIISDINMPKMDGLELSSKIREKNHDIPIILITARTETNCLIKAIELNINHYVLKPINLDDFIDKIYQVSERLQAKETKNLFEQYKLVVDASSIVMKFDLDGKIVYVNDKYTDISAYKKEELENKLFNFNMQENQSPGIFWDLWNSIKNNNIWNGKLKNNTKNGLTYTIDMTIHPILDINQNIKEYISVSHDITDTELVNDILQLQVNDYKGNLLEKNHLLNEYKRSLEQSSILIRLNKDLQIISINNKFLEIIGEKKEDLENKYIFDALNISENQCLNIVTKLSNDSFLEQVIEIKTNKKVIKHLDISFTPILSPTNEIIEFILIGTDISETIDLYKEIELTQRDVIFSLGSIGEARSKETGNHVKRVAYYSSLLARKLGLSEKEAELIETVSPMHDIGKVAIPDEILKKPGKLTKEEFEIMKTHASIGYKMLKNSNREILKASAIVAYEHHEKWDGSGYPRKLSGEDIHIFGRITAVADVFDALGSDRCYKKAWPLNDVINHMKKEAGKHFDPSIVDLLIENLDEFLLIRDNYKDIFKG